VAPPAVVRVIRRCLQKDPKLRLRDVGDAVLELHEAIDARGGLTLPAAGSPVRSRSTLVLAAAVAMALMIGVIATLWALPRLTAPSRDETLPPSRLSTEIDLPNDAPLALDSEAANVGYDSTLLDVSPDGRSLVYVGKSGGESRLFERRLDSFEVRPIPGTEGAIHPFFSPNGRWLGFLTNDKVKTYSFATGTTSTIADVTTGAVGTWTKGDEIFIAAEEGRRLLRMSPKGGSPVLAAGPRDGFRYGRVTPDGKSALVTLVVNGIGADFAQMLLFNLATNESKTLVTNGYDARLTSTGHLVFGRSGRVFAARFNAEREQIEGEPEPIASDVRMHALYPYLQLAVSSAGLMVYVPGGDVAVVGRTARSFCGSNQGSTACSISPTMAVVSPFKWWTTRTTSSSTISSTTHRGVSLHQRAPDGQSGLRRERRWRIRASARESRTEY
jgi:serine/threonine-protein kinase